MISLDIDSFSVEEVVFCLRPINEMVGIVFEPLMAGHVNLGPAVLFQVLNHPIFVCNQFVSNQGEVNFSKLADNHFWKDCEWANQALVPAPVCEVPFEVAVSKSAEPDQGEQDGL